MKAFDMQKQAKSIIANQEYYIFSPVQFGLYRMQLLLDYELYLDKKKAENDNPPAIVPYCIDEFLRNQ